MRQNFPKAFDFLNRRLGSGPRPGNNDRVRQRPFHKVDGLLLQRARNQRHGVLDAEIGQNADLWIQTGPLSKKASRFPFDHSLVGHSRVCKNIDPEEAPSASGAEGQSRPGIIAQHIETQGHLCPPPDFGADDCHGGDRFRGHGVLPERSIAVVFDAERIRPSLQPSAEIRKRALYYRIEPPVVARCPWQRSQVDEADQELWTTGDEWELHESGHGGIFTKSRARNKRFAVLFKRLILLGFLPRLAERALLLHSARFFMWAVWHGSSKEETGEMKENGGSETERVDAVHDAAMTRNNRAVILHASIAFDGRHHQAAIKAHQRYR